MAAIEIDRALAGSVKSLVRTNGTGRGVGLSSERDAERNRVDWEKVIDYQLVEWGRDPSVFADDGLEPPSIDTIALARKVAVVLREHGWESPQRVIPDGEGGMAFEWADGPVFESVDIGADGTVEQTVFRDCKLTALHRLL